MTKWDKYLRARWEGLPLPRRLPKAEKDRQALVHRNRHKAFHVFQGPGQRARYNPTFIPDPQHPHKGWILQRNDNLSNMWRERPRYDWFPWDWSLKRRIGPIQQVRFRRRNGRAWPQHERLKTSLHTEVVEDLRFVPGTKNLLTGVMLSMKTPGRVRIQALFEWKPEQRGLVQLLHRWESPMGETHEKNWMIWSEDGGQNFRLVYKIRPLKIISYRFSRRDFRLRRQPDVKWKSPWGEHAFHLSCLLPLDPHTLLVVIHRHHRLRDRAVRYVRHGLLLDRKTLQVQRVLTGGFLRKELSCAVSFLMQGYIHGPSVFFLAGLDDRLSGFVEKKLVTWTTNAQNSLVSAHA